MTQLLNDDELGAYIALVAAGDLMQRSVAAQLAEHDLSTLQFSILATLLANPDGMRMRDLAEQMVISRSGLTYQVTQLETRQLVLRASSAGDDRGVEVRIADAGRRLMLAAVPGHVELVRRVFFDVVEPGQVAPLRATLENVVARLRARQSARRQVSEPTTR